MGQGVNKKDNYKAHSFLDTDNRNFKQNIKKLNSVIY